MTVAELIEALEAMPQEAEVVYSASPSGSRCDEESIHQVAFRREDGVVRID